MAKQVIQKVIPSDPDLMPDIEEFVLESVKHLNLSDDKLNNLTLSVAEASSNSIVHGNKGDLNKKVYITIEIDEEFLTIKLKDEGEGFDPKKIPDPTAPENILKDSGRGIHIMKSFLEDLRFDFSKSGTEITLVLRIND
ncbi:MAG: ATP-binding protein [Melioribacteraceae bacterium]|nr:ATP-binding protein [Melioribacteraceae bacterium]MCF8353112.1 ATP-binding protein [Melioribacteraceae bacterium]MCF8392742.1 ATP-binding protein [Melioribacteraceae bacterium]MCF8418273.1 ATP-binding protein [Melioribacteraceae bacterium]